MTGRFFQQSRTSSLVAARNMRVLCAIFIFFCIAISSSFRSEEPSIGGVSRLFSHRVGDAAQEVLKSEDDHKEPPPEEWKEPPSPYAYVFYATSDDYACAVLINIHRLQNELATQHRIFVLVTHAISRFYIEALNKANVTVSLQEVPALGAETAGYYSDCMVKLLAFKLHHVDPTLRRILMLDADLMVMQNMDDLFETLPEIDLAAPRAYWLNKGFFTSAFLLITLSERIWDVVSDALDNLGPDKYDMDVLNDLFGEVVLLLPGNYLALNSHYEDWSVPKWFFKAENLTKTPIEKKLRFEWELTPHNFTTIQAEQNATGVAKTTTATSERLDDDLPKDKRHPTRTIEVLHAGGVVKEKTWNTVEPASEGAVPYNKRHVRRSGRDPSESIEHRRAAKSQADEEVSESEDIETPSRIWSIFDSINDPAAEYLHSPNRYRVRPATVVSAAPSVPTSQGLAQSGSDAAAPVYEADDNTPATPNDAEVEQPSENIPSPMPATPQWQDQDAWDEFRRQQRQREKAENDTQDPIPLLEPIPAEQEDKTLMPKESHQFFRDLVAVQSQIKVLHFTAVGKPWSLGVRYARQTRPDAHPLLYDQFELWRALALEMCRPGILEGQQEEQ